MILRNLSFALVALGCSASGGPTDAGAGDSGLPDTAAEVLADAQTDSGAPDAGDAARADSPGLDGGDAGADAPADAACSPACPAGQVCLGGTCYAPQCSPACPAGQVCLGGVCYAPTDAGVDAGPVEHYRACAMPGASCAGGTTCTQALASAPSRPVGSTCTATCTGLASSCPGFVQGQVECVRVSTSAAMQCVRLCNSQTDCAAYNTTCLSVPTASGNTLRFCAPG